MLLPNLIACAGAALLLAIVPGPSTTVILRQMLRGGRSAALAATLANELGAFTWAVAAALGLSALVAASQAAYDALRLVGALVLVYLGAQSLWRSRRPSSPLSTTHTLTATDAITDAITDAERTCALASASGSSAVSRQCYLGAQSADVLAGSEADTRTNSRGEDTRRAFRVGLVTTLANPKAAVFAASFLPQFVPLHAPTLPTLLLLAVVWVLVDLCWYSVLIWTVSRAHARFARSGLRQRLEQVTGLVLIGLGARLAFERG